MDSDSLDLIVKFALTEDLAEQFGAQYRNYIQGSTADLKDITSDAIFTEETGAARVVAKSDGILSGSCAFLHVYRILDPDLDIELDLSDGASFSKGDTVARLHGRIRSILRGERTALNFIGHLSGIATEVHSLVCILEGTKTKILDTRKTLPGLRALEKEAVVHGGGQNHRMGLYDMVLIKDNHIDRSGSITEAVSRVRASYGDKYRVEVETRTIEEVEEASCAGVDRIMLDNMSPRMAKRAVCIVGGRTEIEVSGNMTRGKIRRLKSVCADYISAGYITHSAGHSDFSLLMVRT
jgi:nicotinate-nucleotide pyrophosphorylase (carboxylating)